MSKKYINSNVSDKYLDSPIDESQVDLLDEIWDSISEIEEADESTTKQNLQEVKKKIVKRRIRRVYAVSSSIAASVLFFLFLFLQPFSTEKLSPYAQLSKMGVTISNDQVQLIHGDSTISYLGDAAKIDIDQDLNIKLKSAEGEEIALQKAIQLKIYVPTGKHFNLELSDGTKVVLNSDTWFEYPSTFDSQEARRVAINGEGFFQVKSDKTRPFFVELPNGESIQVIGTSFNVSSYEDNEANITTLLTGEILYHIPTDNRTISILPNQQISINKYTSQVTTNHVDATEFSMWKEGIIYFSNEKLGSITKKLSRMYGIDIIVSKNNYNSRFSGMIRYERGVDYIMNLVTTTSNIKCIIEDGVIYLK